MQDIRKERIYIRASLPAGMHWDLRRLTNGKIGSRNFRSEMASRESLPE
jgi:hypothetical protein